jgi:hypothetical protein
MTQLTNSSRRRFNPHARKGRDEIKIKRAFEPGFNPHAREGHASSEGKLL